MSEGIDYRPDGTIRIEFDEGTWTIARPKLKTYRLFSERLQEMRAAIQQVTTRIAELRALLDDDNTDTIQQQIDEINQPVWEYTIPIIQDIVKQAGDRELPDPEDWPAWLATDMTIPTSILGHWREVPKAPGVAGSN